MGSLSSLWWTIAQLSPLDSILKLQEKASGAQNRLRHLLWAARRIFSQVCLLAFWKLVKSLSVVNDLSGAALPHEETLPRSTTAQSLPASCYTPVMRSDSTPVGGL
ncbi:hypothetical protein VTI74DRAFT_9781 [Chaetomium olivicolor]